MPNLRRPLISFPILCIVAMIVLSSCTDHEIKKTNVPPVNNPPPPGDPLPLPIPENFCSLNFQFGYCDKVSYRDDETIKAYLQSNEDIQLCKLNIYDINGSIAFSIGSPLDVQTIITISPSSQGYGFTPTVEFKVPANTPSGVYLIENKIPFIIKPRSEIDLLVVYPSNTANAYAESGGKSLYSETDRPAYVSFERPIDLQGFSAACLKWFHTLPDLNIGYIADIDLESFETLYRAKILVVVGHNEYWTKTARENFDRYVNSGGHALILSGNTMWWQVRYKDDGKTLVCYKDAALDPESNPLLKTILWNNSSLNYPIMSSIGADFDRGGYGLRTDAGWDGFKVVNPASPLLEGLDLQKGDTIKCPSSEYDGAPIAGWSNDGDPIIDQQALGVAKAEIIAYDKGWRTVETFATFIAVQRNSSSGIIINMGTTDWCSPNGMGGTSGDVIKAITANCIQKLLNDQNVFSN